MKNKIKKYDNFINEINVVPKEIDYITSKELSLFYPNKYDYLYKFNINNHDYVLKLSYLINGDIISYDILLTTQDQYNEFLITFYKIKNKDFLDKFTGSHNFTKEEFKILRNILEKETKHNEYRPVMRSVSFILTTEYNSVIYPFPLSLTETVNKIKINSYRSIIKDSFPKFVEIESEYTSGDKIFYYKTK